MTQFKGQLGKCQGEWKGSVERSSCTPEYRALFGAGPTTSVAAKALGEGAQAVNGSTMREPPPPWSWNKGKRGRRGHKGNTKDQKVGCGGWVKVGGLNEEAGKPGQSLLTLGSEPCKELQNNAEPRWLGQLADLTPLTPGEFVSAKTWRVGKKKKKKNKGKSEGSCISKERGWKKCCKEMIQPKMLPEFRVLMQPLPSAAATLSVAFPLTATLIPQPFEVLFHIFVIYFCNRTYCSGVYPVVGFRRKARGKTGPSAPSPGATEKLQQVELERLCFPLRCSQFLLTFTPYLCFPNLSGHKKRLEDSLKQDFWVPPPEFLIQ